MIQTFASLQTFVTGISVLRQSGYKSWALVGAASRA
jgi:hypothetical protein